MACIGLQTHYKFLQCIIQGIKHELITRRHRQGNILDLETPLSQYVYVFLLFVHVFLSLSMYTYFCLCILIVFYVFLDAATLTEVFPCFFLGCKANARV